MTKGTKARTAIAVCALALAAASAQVASGEAGETSTLPRADAAAAKDGSSRDAANRCPARLVSARAGVARLISIRCRLPKQKRANRVNRAPARIANRPDEGRILAVDQDRNMVRYRARPGFVGRDRFVVVRRSRGVTWRTVVRVSVIKEGPLAPPASPKCTAPQNEKTNYQTPAEFTVSCTGNGLAVLKVVSEPADGSVIDEVPGGSPSNRTLTVTYLPNKLYVGGDGLKIEASEPGSATGVPVPIKVLPWRMRALGDSATAGFGLFGAKGEEMKNLFECKPIEPLNDRCSSNSEVGEGSTGPLSWSPDFGLKNNVSWAAQFAEQWQGGGHITAPVMFQNRAVTGSTPADWLPNGELNQYLTTIVGENPDLIAFTLGVNPLLDRILLKGEDGECIEESTSVQGVIECIEPMFNQEAVKQRLEAIYNALLGARDAEVVTIQYHLAFPVYAEFPDGYEPWNIEVVINYLNAQIAAAVKAVKTASPPARASRLTLIEAQVDPTDADPLKVRRFNIGIPPNSVQTWPTNKCGGTGVAVDGPSHQSKETQASLKTKYKSNFCAGVAWTIDADTGIHPNKIGYTQFARALYNVAVKEELVPKLPCLKNC